MGIVGIDVSKHNGKLDWKSLKEQEVAFALVRCGVGDNIPSQHDERFNENVQGCIDNNIPWGVYIYSYAINPDEQRSEVEHVLTMLSGLPNPPMGIWLDEEDSDPSYSRVEHGLDTDLLESYAEDFLNLIKAHYPDVPVGIYASHSWLDSYFDVNALKSLGYLIWEAHWGVGNLCKEEASILQTSSNGEFENHDCRFDINVLTDDTFNHVFEDTDVKDEVSELDFNTLVNNTLTGVYGNGEDRINSLGSRYNEVQGAINELFSVAKTTKDMLDNSEFDINTDMLYNVLNIL